ncbi:MAG TPA: glutamate-5-semialdehyde dehydrogenase [Clostridiaceae bacterium]|jgi:glutamate-5-semialdehyde dehydrogenase|nr:glutamate-5-semialdehyde dehydrogenase [Clostridiaceae bacterium]
MNVQEYVKDYGRRAKSASRVLAVTDTVKKNRALELAAEKIKENRDYLIKENEKDIEYAINNGISSAMVDRLRLTDKRIDDMATGLIQLANLPDPIGEVIHGTVRPNGLEILKKRVPLGVIGIIFESRPNVTADAAGLCVKSGNACILRGGSEAVNSNIAIAKLFREALKDAGLPEDCVNLIDNTDRAIVNALMKLNKYVDVLIPRGGKGLINNVVMNSTVPVIQTGEGICHLYVDCNADLDMALNVTMNAKIQRPSVCNAIETLLVSKTVADKFLPVVVKELMEKNVEVRVCSISKEILGNMEGVKDADDSDWDTEYNDLVLSIKTVAGIEEAIEHINSHGTMHSESIITTSYDKARKFQSEVDASSVYVNCSTRFTDGFEFGLGAEIGISNQKLHARGPMGLYELTTVKYLINGNGQVRE